ncbi:MAG TPA: anti-sigma factor [Candidatus Angelobacter sp.]|nr:anti-sigma factor [Candidatus Angelobacter sp.]
MNAHPQYAEALALYAMGTLDSPEDLAALQAHLGACGDCRRELEALRADVAFLALSATGPQPPARSRQRLLSAIAAEPRLERRQPKRYAVGRLRSRWFTFAPVMVMLLLALFSILLWLDLRNTRRDLRHARAEMAQMHSELEQRNKELADAKAVTDLLHAPDAKQMVLVIKKTPAQPQMKMIYSPQKGSLLLMASNTPALPGDKIYELWLLPADGSAPMAAGWFKPDGKGNGMIFHKLKSAGIEAKGFAVTVEPASGSQSPTMPIVMEPAG